MRKIIHIIFALSLLFLIRGSSIAEEAEPVVVSALPGAIPSDAVVLFNGGDLSRWVYPDGRDATWIVENGELLVMSRSIVGNYNQNNIVTREHFGDMQIHLEFRAPVPAKGDGQKRGNSGVKIHGIYELQVLDSYENYTEPDRSSGAIYRQHAPLVNASRPPGIWQTYDIIFHAARFDAGGKVTHKPTITVLHNGVLIQDNAEIKVPTGRHKDELDKPAGPIVLQDHVNPVRYRNIWVRCL